MVEMNTLSGFLRCHQIYDGECNFTNFKGGKYFVDDSEIELFRKLYVREYTKNPYNLSLNQNIKQDETFKFFLELDGTITPSLQNSINKVMIEKFGKRSDKRVLLTNNINGNSHLHFLNIYLTKKHAKIICEEIDDEWKTNDDYTSKVVDKSYGGLRVIGSYKLTGKGVYIPEGDITEETLSIFDIRSYGKHETKSKVDLIEPVIVKRVYKETYGDEEPNLDFIWNILQLLPNEWREDYDKWIKVGFCLKNENVPEEIYHRWSEQSSKYDSDACSKVYNSNSTCNKPIKLGTLIKASKEKSPNEVKELMKKKNGKEKKSEIVDDKTIAEFFYKMFSNNYIYCDDDKYWLIFSSKKGWRKGSDINITKKLTELSDEFECLKFSNKASSVIKKLKEMYLDEERNINEKLNVNPYLLGFNNGVYNLKDNKFRDYLPSDFVSYSCNYDLPTNSNVNTRRDINLCMKNILPNDDLRNYFLEDIASCLCGIHTKKFRIILGDKDSGKTTLMELINLTFGDYAGKFDPSYFINNKKSSEGANPFLLNNMKKRFVDCPEFNMEDKLQSNIIKQFTGDSIQGRLLFSSTIISGRPQWNIFLHTNDLPLIDAQDGALVDRLYPIKFNSLFVDNPDINNPNEFKINRELSDKFEEWRQEFMLMLLELYFNIKKTNEPEIINELREHYRRDCDTFQGVENMFIKTDNEMNYVSKIDAVDFILSTLSLERKKSREVFKWLKKHLGDPQRLTIDKKRLYGWRKIKMIDLRN